MKLPDEITAILHRDLPDWAKKPHPSRSYLTAINPMAVIIRLNEAFGVGGWVLKTEPVSAEKFMALIKEKEVEKTMCVVKATLQIPEYDIHLEQYGGNDNDDMGDAYKGATTDALTKMASYLGIGLEVYLDSSAKPPYVNKTDDGIQI